MFTLKGKEMMENAMNMICQIMDSNIYLGAGIILLLRVVDVSMGTF